MKKFRVLFICILLCLITLNITAYDYTDNVEPSKNPPNNLPLDLVPQFVTISFDDNGISGHPDSGVVGGMQWAIDMLRSRTNPVGYNQAELYDGTITNGSFYMTTSYIDSTPLGDANLLKQVWHQAYLNGNELGNHTHDHGHPFPNPYTQILNDITKCTDWLTKPYTEPVTDTTGIGVALEDVTGFRSPYLECNDAVLKAVKAAKLMYDCSIEEGYDLSDDGSNYYWPYTLDNGSPGNKVLFDMGVGELISSHPGLWEIPVYCLIAPPDEKCAEYGIETGFRKRLKAEHPWFDEIGGKITGFDYNLFYLFNMSNAEALAVLKYSLDLRLEGNKAPFIFNAHSEYYSDKKIDGISRQAVIEEFLDYALSKKEVRVVSAQKMLDWMRNPVCINQTTPTPTPTATPDPIKNIACGKPVKTSSSYAQPYAPENITDCNDMTIWAPSIADKNPWVYIDLQKVTEICGVGIDTFNQYFAKTYHVYISADGATWTKAYTGKKKVPGMDKLIVDYNVPARYVGFVFGDFNNITVGITEIEIYSRK